MNLTSALHSQINQTSVGPSFHLLLWGSWDEALDRLYYKERWAVDYGHRLHVGLL